MLMIQKVLFFFAMMVRTSSGTTLSSNAAEFTVVCRIFRIAIKGSDVESEAWLANLKPDRKRPAHGKTVEELIQELNITNGVKTVLDLEGRRISIPKSRQQQIQLKRVLQVAGRINTLEQEEAEIYKSLKLVAGDVAGKFKRVVNGSEADKYGDPDLATAGGGGQRDARCKASGGGLAGKSIKLDMTCLCTHIQTHDGHCGFTAGGGAWANSGNNQVDGAWKTIEAECYKQKLQIDLNPAFINHSLAAFESQLGRQGTGETTGTKGVQHVLGKLLTNHGTNGCGKDSQEAACVDYKANGGERAQIHWLEDMKKASGELEKMLAQVDKMKKVRAKVEYLEELAAAIFNETILQAEVETTLTSQAVQSSSQKSNPNHPTDKTTAQDPNAVSVAEIPRFILPWSLLI